MNVTDMRLDLPDGTLSCAIYGPAEGPILFALPGMGDIKDVYFPLLTMLLDQGWRVAVIDLPGHGESTAGMKASQSSIAGALIDLAEHFAVPAIAIGHSYTPDSALYAAQRSDHIRGVVCLSPWATTPELDGVKKWVTRLVVRTPWLWTLFYRSLHKKTSPDARDHERKIRQSLRREKGTVTLEKMAMGKDKDAESARRQTTVPVAVVMGAKDPDFKDPVKEAQDFAEQCAGRVVMAEGVGHYPHTESPELVMNEVVALARECGVIPCG